MNGGDPRAGIGLDCRLLCSFMTDVPAKNIPNLCIVVPDTGLAIDFPPPRALPAYIHRLWQRQLDGMSHNIYGFY